MAGEQIPELVFPVADEAAARAMAYAEKPHADFIAYAAMNRVYLDPRDVRRIGNEADKAAEGAYTTYWQAQIDAAAEAAAAAPAGTDTPAATEERVAEPEPAAPAPAAPAEKPLTDAEKRVQELIDRILGTSPVVVTMSHVKDGKPHSVTLGNDLGNQVLHADPNAYKQQLGAAWNHHALINGKLAKVPRSQRSLVKPEDRPFEVLDVRPHPAGSQWREVVFVGRTYAQDRPCTVSVATTLPGDFPEMLRLIDGIATDKRLFRHLIGALVGDLEERPETWQYIQNMWKGWDELATRLDIGGIEGAEQVKAGRYGDEIMRLGMPHSATVLDTKRDGAVDYYRYAAKE